MIFLKKSTFFGILLFSSCLFANENYENKRIKEYEKTINYLEEKFIKTNFLSLEKKDILTDFLKIKKLIAQLDGNETLYNMNLLKNQIISKDAQLNKILHTILSDLYILKFKNYDLIEESFDENLPMITYTHLVSSWFICESASGVLVKDVKFERILNKRLKFLIKQKISENITFITKEGYEMIKDTYCFDSIIFYLNKMAENGHVMSIETKFLLRKLFFIIMYHNYEFDFRDQKKELIDVKMFIKLLENVKIDTSFINYVKKYNYLSSQK